MKNYIPICFYPTRKIILDDDDIFTKSVLLKMNDRHFSAHASPEELLNFLLNKYTPSFKQTDLFGVEHESHLLPRELSLQINKWNFNASNGVSDISVVLIDYHLPTMKGIDLLYRIKQAPYKKILITGEQDYTIGINALNEGLIDAYIRKDDSNFLNKLNILVSDLEWRYFTELSSASYYISELEYLKDSNLFEKFSQIIFENNISSFFLVNMEGDFSILNNNEGQNFLVVRSKKRLYELSLIAKEDGASKEVVNKLAKFEVIPFFGNNQYWQIPASKWDDFLYPANLLPNNSNLVWAMISPFSSI